MRLCLVLVELINDLEGTEKLERVMCMRALAIREMGEYWILVSQIASDVIEFQRL